MYIDNDTIIEEMEKTLKRLSKRVKEVNDPFYKAYHKVLEAKYILVGADDEYL